jgi:hypothetical protein
MELRTDVVLVSTAGATDYIDDSEGNTIEGITEWDDQREASHLPTALKGLSTKERARWLEQQRLKDKEASEKEQELRRDALKASQDRYYYECYFSILPIIRFFIPVD